MCCVADDDRSGKQTDGVNMIAARWRGEVVISWPLKMDSIDQDHEQHSINTQHDGFLSVEGGLCQAFWQFVLEGEKSQLFTSSLQMDVQLSQAWDMQMSTVQKEMSD